MDGAVDLGTYQRAIMSREGRNQVTARAVCGILHGWSRRYRPPTNIYCKIARLGRGKFRIILRTDWNILRITWNILRYIRRYHAKIGEEPGSSTGRLWPSMDGAVDLGTYQYLLQDCKIGTGEISDHTPNRLEHTPNYLEYPPIYPAIAPTISGCTARLWPSVAL